MLIGRSVEFTPRAHRARRWSGGRSLLVLLAISALVATACGSRRSETELLAAATGSQDASPITAPGDSKDFGVSDGQGAVDTPDGDAPGSSSPVVGATDAGQAGVDQGPAGDGQQQQQPADQRPDAPKAGGGAPLVIGTVGTLSGVAGASLTPLAEGVQIWAQWVNDHGGVNGHPVQVIVGDDGGDPARHQSLVQEFVEQRNVVAFVGNPEALTGAGSVGYLTKKGVPVIGADGAGGWFYESPVYFPQGSHGDALLQAGGVGAAASLKPEGITRVGTITCVEAQVCRDAHEKLPAIMKANGLTVVYQAQASLGQPDFTAECLAADDEDVEFLTLGMDATSITKIAQACARLGFRPIFGWTAGSAVASHAEDPNLDGARIGSIVAPWPARGTQRLDEFQQAMSTFAPSTNIAGGHMLGWVAAKVFELGVIKADDPTDRASLLKALGSLRGDLLPDLTGPLLYRPGQPSQPSVCAFGVTIKDKKFVPGNGGRRACGEFDPNL